MLFNSIGYALFLPAIFAGYWLLGKYYKAQNALVLIASYYFYSCWDWRFVGLLLFSTMLDYISGIQIARSARVNIKHLWLWISIGLNLGLLGFFKYYNFFADSIKNILHGTGINVNPVYLNIILPIGISFYTFHGLSYIIDIYKCKIKPEKNFVTYALFVSFFPLLVAGPIERATHLLPQFKKKRQFRYEWGIDGLKQILWGLFKKVVIADQCAQPVNEIFLNYTQYNGSTRLIGAVLFAVQVYCDFSGYSDIAIGTARLLGIELFRNFSYPYFSKNIAEFWRRWHISLTSWFRDYIYIPLGGNRKGKTRTIINTVIIFVLSGLWHGAKGSFVAWGFLNALYFMPVIFIKNNKHDNIDESQIRLPSFRYLIQMISTFGIVVFSFIFFRSKNLYSGFMFTKGVLSPSLFSIPLIRPYNIALWILVMFFFEWINRTRQYGLQFARTNCFIIIKVILYYLLSISVLYFARVKQEFIYFQF